MLCLACEYRRSEGSAGLTGYILWPAAVPWTGGFSIQTRWCRRSLLPRGDSKQTTVQFLAVILTCTRPTRPASANEAEPLSSCRFGGMPST